LPAFWHNWPKLAESIATDPSAEVMILIAGATGTNGMELIKLLARQGIGIRALVRSPDRAMAIAHLPGVELMIGDLRDHSSIETALSGVQRAFLVTNSSEEAQSLQCRFVDTARHTGLQHIVKLSQLAADPASPMRFLRYHGEVENVIRASGIRYTFLRPNLFMQGLLVFRSSIATTGKFFAAADDAKVSVVDVRDIAAAAAAALTQPGHEGRIYDLTGPEALTHTEMAAQLSHAVGRQISFVDITPEAMKATLVDAGLPLWQADGLLEDYAHYRRDEASVVASGVTEATGASARSFAVFARDYAPHFS
jgi:uncharacterized protein YbjT (DUF2867 family)